MNWVPFTIEGPHPPERCCVLVQFEKADTRYSGLLPTVVVGYLRYAAGCKDAPYFVTPGFERSYVPADGVPTNSLGTVQRQSTHWCGCLGDDFEAPLRAAKDMNRRPVQLNARQALNDGVTMVYEGKDPYDPLVLLCCLQDVLGWMRYATSDDGVGKGHLARGKQLLNDMDRVYGERRYLPKTIKE